VSRARLALLQSNPVVGDIAGNAEQIVAAVGEVIAAHKVPSTTRRPHVVALDIGGHRAKEKE